MRMLSGSFPTHSRPWLLSTLTLLFLTGCATTRLAEGDQPSKVEALDLGYGTINQDHLVGSATTVYGEDSPVEHPRTVVEMLALVPGVRVKESSTGEAYALVRGATPLYVLDGMIYHGSLSSINPSTVESITVLKNAGETAMFGSRAAHGGVILIKTKGGSK
jgi:TonB-dependent SusC/RagA subfamily outer membrane receptor